MVLSRLKYTLFTPGEPERLWRLSDADRCRSSTTHAALYPVLVVRWLSGETIRLILPGTWYWYGTVYKRRSKGASLSSFVLFDPDFACCVVPPSAYGVRNCIRCCRKPSLSTHWGEATKKLRVWDGCGCTSCFTGWIHE